MAGVAGLEPANVGVKSHALPLGYTPIFSFLMLHFSLTCGINVITKLIGGIVLWQKKKRKRARRTVEDRIAEIDAKIAALEAKKQELLRPAKMKKIIEEASANMTPEEMAENLALSFNLLTPPQGGVYFFSAPALPILQAGTLADQTIPSSPLW